MSGHIPKSRAKTAYGLLSDVRRRIIHEPKRYNQTVWIVNEHTSAAFVECDAPRGLPSCGTVACVSGWVTTLGMTRQCSWHGVRGSAQRLLGLTDVQAYELFREDAVSGDVQTVAHARAGAAHIKRFQDRYAAQLKATKIRGQQ